MCFVVKDSKSSFQKRSSDLIIAPTQNRRKRNFIADAALFWIKDTVVDGF